MFLALPILVFAMLLTLLRRRGETWRIAVLLSMAGCGLAHVAIIELLSVPRILSPATVATGWTLAAISLALVLWRTRLASRQALIVPGTVAAGAASSWSSFPSCFPDTTAEPEAAPPAHALDVQVPADSDPPLRHQAPSTRHLLSSLSWPMRIALALLFLILATLLLITLFVPPNTWDTMTYHLPRVMHWIQNGSVAPYPTHIARQVQQPAFHEYSMMLTILFWGSDQLVNIPQYIAMLGCLVSVSLIAKHLGASLRGQALAAIVAGTMPMLMLQSTSTQNDCTNAFWVAASIALGMEIAFSTQPPRWLLLVGLGVTCGLALFTKATAYVYMAPALSIWAVVMLLKYRQRAVLMGTCVGAILLAINLPHYARNLSMTGLPLGPTAEQWEGKEYPYRNEHFSLATTGSNIVRNITDEIGTPWYRWNRRIYETSLALHAAMGWDPQNPDTTWRETPYRVAPMWKSEDYCPSPLHFTLLTLASLTCLLMPNGYRLRTLGYVVLLAAMFTTFSFYLRWQMWHCRLLLPFMVAGTALTATVIDRVWRWPGVYIVILGLMAATPPYLFWAQSRPLLGNNSVLTADRWAMRCWSSSGQGDRYKQMAQRVKEAGAQSIGLVVGNNVWEYPIWVALREAGVTARIQHVQIKSYTAYLADRPPFANFTPDGTLTNTVYNPTTRPSVAGQ